MAGISEYPLPEPRYRDLRRLFSVWVGRVVFRTAGIKKSVPEFQDLQEVENMPAFMGIDGHFIGSI